MKFIKSKIFIALALGLIAIIIYFTFFTKTEAQYITEIAQREDVNQIVSVNGTVEAPAVIELRFQNIGKIYEIFVKVGDKVKKGDKLASLETEKLRIDAQRAKAGLEMAQAELNLKYAGPGNEEVRVSESKIQEAVINMKNSEEKYKDTLLANAEKLRRAELEVTNAEISLKNAEEELENYQETGINVEEKASADLEKAYNDARTTVNYAIDKIKDAITASDTVLAIDNKSADVAFRDFKGAQATSELNEAKIDYKLSKEKLTILENYYNGIINTWEDSEVGELLEKAKEALIQTRELLLNTYAVLKGTPTDYYFTQSDLETLKNKISTQQNLITDNLSSVENLIQTILRAKLEITSASLSSGLSLSSAQAKHDKAKVALEMALSALEEIKVENIISENSTQRDIDVKKVLVEQARANHDKLIASPRAVDTASLKARVEQAKAEHMQALRSLEDMELVSPVSGTITIVNINLGENIDALVPAMVLISDSLQIKANIPETDITKLKVNDSVEITLDAFPLDKVFTGKIISINPAETIVQGVVYYETTIILESEEPQIKSGMTTNMDIHTGKSENVIAISPQAVHYENGNTFIYVLENGEKVRREIKIGLEGINKVEVLSGLEEDETVILYEK